MLMQFAGTSTLPTSAPLEYFRGVLALTQGLNAFLESEGDADVNLVVSAASSLLQSGKDGAAQLPGALLAACFSVCYCLRVQPALPERVRSRVAVLHGWLEANAQTALGVPPLVARMLARFTDLGAAAARDAFYVGKDSSTEDILRVRVLVHLAAAATSARPGQAAATNPLLGFFATLLYQPERLAHSYLPQMPEDELAYVMKVLGGRWYRCQNGHAYYVDMCGRPTEINKCATCGCDIGGLSHNLLGTNQDVDGDLSGDTNYHKRSQVHDNSRPHYFLEAVGTAAGAVRAGVDGSSSSSSSSSSGGGGGGGGGAAGDDGAAAAAQVIVDATLSVRGLEPSSCRAQRLLLHAGLVVGSVFGGEPWRAHVHVFAGSVVPDPARMPQFFAAHYAADWERLKACLRKSGDDAELLVHAAVASLVAEARDPTKSRIFDFAALPSRDLRAAWEKEFSESVLVGLMGPAHVDSSLARLKAEHHDENARAVARLLQEKALWSFSDTQRGAEAPALFRFRPAFSVEDFVNRIASAAGGEFKLLKMFMTEQGQLRCLQHLGDVLRWERLLTVHFNRRISSSDAATITVARVLETVGRDQLQWHRAWQGFQTAWSMGWQFVSRFTCTELPAMYKEVTMGPEATINLCLPASEDAGICATALTTYLTTKHNEVVEATQKHLRARGGRGTGGGQQQQQEEQISSQMFSHIHAVTVHPDKFIDYVQRHCLIYSQETGQLEYDMHAAERWLVDVEFATCPSVRLEMDRITYLDEQLSSNARTVLREHVPQVELPPDVLAALAAEFQNPTVAHSCIEALDLVLVFMQEVLRGGMGAQLGATNLNRHVKSVLLTEEDLFKSKSLCSEVKVWHVDSLYDFLWAQVSTDDFPQVLEMYKVKLNDGFVDAHGKSHRPADARALEELRAVAPRLELKALVLCMSRLMKDQLSGTMSTGFSIYDSMLPYEEEGLPESFEALFPQALLMGHFVEVYKLLDNLSTLGGE